MTKEQIEHVAFSMIKESIDNPYEYCDRDKNLDMIRVTTLGYIYGICCIADVLIDEVENGN